MTYMKPEYDHTSGRVRKAEKDDLCAVVDVHSRSFVGFFLTFLGSDFLYVLYKNILLDPGGIFFVAEQDQRIVGFVAGVDNLHNFFTRIIKEERWSFARAALTSFLKKPSIAPRLIRALRKEQETRDKAAQACLMSIATLSESENVSVGERLIHAFCCELAKREIASVFLTTDTYDNERVIIFYERLGFRLARQFVTTEGRHMNEYEINLNPKDWN
jgi:ribosomal protein S18 acetylase RimI-like enzyme